MSEKIEEGHAIERVCVFFPFILDIKFVGRTSRGHTGERSHRISPPPFCGACLYFLARRIQPFLSLVDRDSRILCTNDFIVLHPLGIVIFSFIVFFLVFLVRKIPFAGIELTSQRVRGLRGTYELPGRPAIERVWYTVSREPSDIPPDHNYLAFAPEGIASTTTPYQSFRLLYIICCTVDAAWGVLGPVQSTRLGGCFSTLL